MSKKKIIICDDEEGIRESLKLILENKYELTLTESGRQCLDKLKENPDIDLVILDIKMPQLSGLEVIKQIKKIKSEAKIVILSGYRSVETAAEASHLGADDYLTKPFEDKDVLQAIERATK